MELLPSLEQLPESLSQVAVLGATPQLSVHFPGFCTPPVMLFRSCLDKSRISFVFLCPHRLQSAAKFILSKATISALQCTYL
jgi:hypothetical protein